MGVNEGNDVSTTGVWVNSMGIKVAVISGVEVLVLNATNVGVMVKVAVGTVGVNVGAFVGALVVSRTGPAVGLTCGIKEHERRNAAKIKMAYKFFICKQSFTNNLKLTYMEKGKWNL